MKLENKVTAIIEQRYISNYQLKLALEGFTSVLNLHKKEIRIVYDTKNINVNKTRILVIFGLSLSWIEKILDFCISCNVHPLVYGAKPRVNTFNFSYISKDYKLCFYSLVNAMVNKDNNIHNLAFIGFNPNSPHDLYKLDGFVNACNNHKITYKVFENNGNPKVMLTSLIKEEKDFDGLCFANDSLLYLYLKDLNCAPTKLIASYGKFKMRSSFDFSYFSAAIDYKESGTVLGNLYLFLNKQKEIYPTNIQLPPIISYGNIPINIDIENAHVLQSNVDFYKNNDIRNIQNIEKMFELMDDIDEYILRGIIKGDKYEDIASSCYVSLNTIKYRLSKLIQEAGVNNRKELCELLLEYKIKV